MYLIGQSMFLEQTFLWLIILWSLVGGPFLIRSYLRSKIHGELSAKIIPIWTETIILLLVVFFLYKKIFLQLLNAPSLSYLFWSVMCALILFLLMGFSSYFLNKNASSDSPMQTQVSYFANLSFPQIFVLSATAGICEEIIYRGIAIETITSATNSIYIGGIISGLFFIWHHKKGWGLKWLIPVALSTIVLTALYILTRNLMVVIFAHVLVDFLSFSIMKLKIATR